MWFFVEEPWQYRVLDLLPPGVDRTLIERARKMTASERIDALEELCQAAEELRCAGETSRKSGTGR